MRAGNDLGRVREVAPGVHRLGSAFVNWYLVEGDGNGLTAVDAGLPRYGLQLHADLAALRKEIGAVVALVLTHGHGDHVGVAPALVDAGAQIYAHAGDADLITTREVQKPEVGLARYLLRYRSARHFVMHFLRNGGQQVARLEFESVSDGERLEVPGRPRALHLPGHTRGHCAWQFDDHRALFVGDAIVTWNPYTGRRGPQIPSRASNSNSGMCMRSLRRLVDVRASIVLSGHGDPVPGPVADVVALAEAAGFS
jgi:glyoxylase-like metal-dependent hydrolase (beta-lactamase superfamily II)